MLHIKNMVCPRCIKVVREELESIGLPVFEVELGRATVCASVAVMEETIQAVLERNEFELLCDSKSELVEQNMAGGTRKRLLGGSYIELSAVLFCQRRPLLHHPLANGQKELLQLSDTKAIYLVPSFPFGFQLVELV